MATVASELVDNLRNHDARHPTGEVVVERLECLLSPPAALAIELAQKLFGLGSQRKNRTTRTETLSFERDDALKLSVTISRSCVTTDRPESTNPARPATGRCSQVSRQFGDLRGRDPVHRHCSSSGSASIRHAWSLLARAPSSSSIRTRRMRLASASRIVKRSRSQSSVCPTVGIQPICENVKPPTVSKSSLSGSP